MVNCQTGNGGSFKMPGKISQRIACLLVFADETDSLELNQFTNSSPVKGVPA